MNIDHINIVVTDFEKAKIFFLDLGFTVTKPQDTLQGKWLEMLTGLKNAKAEYISLGFPNSDTNLELMQYYSPIGGTDPKISQLNQIGFRHVAIAVKDIEKLVEQLKRKGVTFLSDIQIYNRTKQLCYLHGPDGIIVELAEYGEY